jgi:hypothetical protein
MSTRQLNETVVRLVALAVLLIVLSGYLGIMRWVALFLAVDFYLRGFVARPFSPLAGLGRQIAGLLRLPKKPINAGPKLFAARLGFLFSVIVAVCSFAGWQTAAYIVAGMLAFCAALEAFFAFCVGCHMYTLMLKVMGKK